jgi:hypothetical protein
VAGSDHTISVRIKTPVSLGVREVAQEYARHGARRKFVSSGRSQVRIALASEHTQVIIGWWVAIEKLVWRSVVARTTGMTIERVGSSAKRLEPERGRDGGVEQESAHAIIESAKNTLGTSIFL